jgi:hypothetical protein
MSACDNCKISPQTSVEKEETVYGPKCMKGHVMPREECDDIEKKDVDPLKAQSTYNIEPIIPKVKIGIDGKCKPIKD